MIEIKEEKLIEILRQIAGSYKKHCLEDIQHRPFAITEYHDKDGIAELVHHAFVLVKLGLMTEHGEAA
jgi:hypothetical protein